jgi:hypothetical protein
MQGLPILLCAVILGWAATSHAHTFPSKAPTLKASLVQGYPACTSPDTTTSAGRPACSAPEVDSDCLFGFKSSGQITATISKTSVKMKLSLRGLDPGCEGRVLVPGVTVRSTTDDCLSGEHCTVADYEVSGAGCTVRNGKCASATSVPTGYQPGAGSEMTIIACGVKDGEQTAFPCGIMVK